MRKLPLLVALAAPLMAQTIDGDVVDAVTGKPVAGVYIATPGMKLATPVFTGADGHFRLNLGSGRLWGIHFQRSGYLGRQRRLPTQLTGSANMRVELTPQAVISGTVLDADGLPVEGACVQALRYRMVEGRRQLANGQMQNETCETNERGEYRVFGLAAGRYYLWVDDAGKWDERYSGQFRGGTREPDERTAVEVKAGQEAANVDCTLARVEGVRVSGQLATNSGREAIVALEPVERWLGRRHATSYSRAGAFTLRHVLPGRYRLTATTGNSIQPKPADLVDTQMLEVGTTDVSGISLNLRPQEAVNLAGTLEMEEGGEAPATEIRLSAHIGSLRRTAVSEGGKFTLPGVPPGRHNLEILPAGGYNAVPRDAIPITMDVRLGAVSGYHNMLKVEPGGATDLHITLAGKRARLTGTLRDAAGAPAAYAMLCLRRKGALRHFLALTDGQGNFTWSGPAGDFELLAAPEADEENTPLTDPDFLTGKWGSFPALHLEAGENPAVDLRPRATR
jgi:hypothetical protein